MPSRSRAQASYDDDHLSVSSASSASSKGRRGSRGSSRGRRNRKVNPAPTNYADHYSVSSGGDQSYRSDKRGGGLYQKSDRHSDSSSTEQSARSMKHKHKFSRARASEYSSIRRSNQSSRSTARLSENSQQAPSVADEWNKFIQKAAEQGHLPHAVSDPKEDDQRMTRDKNNRTVYVSNRESNSTARGGLVMQNECSGTGQTFITEPLPSYEQPLMKKASKKPQSKGLFKKLMNNHVQADFDLRETYGSYGVNENCYTNADRSFHGEFLDLDGDDDTNPEDIAPPDLRGVHPHRFEKDVVTAEIDAVEDQSEGPRIFGTRNGLKLQDRRLDRANNSVMERSYSVRHVPKSTGDWGLGAMKESKVKQLSRRFFSRKNGKSEAALNGEERHPPAFSTSPEPTPVTSSP